MQTNPNPQDKEQKKTFHFMHTIACPNCPVVCYSFKGGINHAEKCYERRRLGLCCLCRKESPYEINKPDYYSPENERYWFVCIKCYEWAKKKGLTI